MNNPKRAFLHCSATPDYDESNKVFDIYGAADIDEWHRKRGWREIGYHYVIRRSGIVEKGSREWNEYGAHVKGQNKDSLGICYIGTSKPTLMQVDSLLAVFGMVWEEFNIKPEQWFGHYEFDKMKSCPNISMEIIREMFRLELKRMLHEMRVRQIQIVQV